MSTERYSVFFFRFLVCQTERWPQDLLCTYAQSYAVCSDLAAYSWLVRLVGRARESEGWKLDRKSIRINCSAQLCKAFFFLVNVCRTFFLYLVCRTSWVNEGNFSEYSESPVVHMDGRWKNMCSGVLFCTTGILEFSKTARDFEMSLVKFLWTFRVPSKQLQFYEMRYKKTKVVTVQQRSLCGPEYSVSFIHWYERGTNKSNTATSYNFVFPWATLHYT